MAVATGSSETTTAPRPSAVTVGTVIWLASELMFFGGLFAAYFFLRSASDVWPPRGTELATARTAVATAVLVTSSFTMHGAVAAARRHEIGLALRWIAVTIVLGLLFVGNQATEYAEADFSISTDAYGSMFFLMTGFHGLHVIGGLVFMLVVAGIIGGRGSRAPAAEVVDVCSYYWHFVDIVWVAMFTTIYLIR